MRNKLIAIAVAVAVATSSMVVPTTALGSVAKPDGLRLLLAYPKMVAAKAKSAKKSQIVAGVPVRVSVGFVKSGLNASQLQAMCLVARYNQEGQAAVKKFNSDARSNLSKECKVIKTS